MGLWKRQSLLVSFRRRTKMELPDFRCCCLRLTAVFTRVRPFLS